MLRAAAECLAKGTLGRRSISHAALSTVVPQLPPFNHTPSPYDGPKYEEVLEKRHRYLSPGLSHYYKDPLMIVEGKMQYLYDHTGRRYLDGFGGIVTVSVGHCHPKVLQAISAQSALLQHTTTIYLHHQAACYAEELAATLPGDLSVCYFVNSGSEANDLALLMARAHTGAFDAIALRSGYHGMSAATMGLTAHAGWKFPQPQGFGVHHALNPDAYRGAFGADGPAYAADVADIIATATPGRVAAFVHESIQGVGGAVPLAPGYLPAAYAAVRAAGGLAVADEVQTGFGRTGGHFWGFQAHGVVPDIVTMAKGIGNGVALGAVVTTPAIAAALTQRLFFNTFGGNPPTMAAGRAVLRVVQEEGLQMRCAEAGGALLSGLRRLQETRGLIGDCRGAGLMLGVELVKDRKTKQPAPEAAKEVLERCRRAGLLLGKGGLRGNVLRIKPPMCVSDEDVRFMLEVLDDALRPEGLL